MAMFGPRKYLPGGREYDPEFLDEMLGEGNWSPEINQDYIPTTDKCYACNKRWLELEVQDDPTSWIWTCIVYPDKAKKMLGCELKAERQVKGE